MLLPNFYNYTNIIFYRIIIIIIFLPVQDPFQDLALYSVVISLASLNLVSMLSLLFYKTDIFKEERPNDFYSAPQF